MKGCYVGYLHAHVVKGLSKSPEVIAIQSLRKGNRYCACLFPT